MVKSPIAEPLLDPRLLLAFVTVAETSSFTEAARQLGIAQQSLSVQIARLERDLELRLFDRTTRRVELSAPGRRLYADAREVLDKLAGAKRNVARAARGETGELTIGCGGFAVETVLPEILMRFRSAYADVAVTLHEAHSTEQIDALLRGDIDAGLMLLPSAHPDLRAELISSDGFSVAVAESEYAGPQPVPLEHFRSSPFLAGPRSQSPGLDDVKAALFRTAGFTPNVVQIASRSTTLFALVAAKIGVMLTPGSATRIAQQGVAFVPLQTQHRAELFLVTRRDEGSPVLRNFCTIVRELASARVR